MKEKKYLIVDNHTLGKVFKRIGIEKRNDTKILIDTDDKSPHDITLKNAVILMACVVEEGDKFYS